MPTVASAAPALAPRTESLHMRRLRGGDAHAIEQLFREYQPRLLSFCRHMLGSQEEAEDVVQLTFLAAHVQLPHERIETNVSAWLYTVARRKCIDVLRRRHADLPLEPDRVSTAGLAAEVEMRDDLRRLVADVQRLDDTHRAALVLTQLEALSQAHVAQVLGTHEARVRRLVFEARQELLGRRESRNLACRAVQEELANARGSQFRRRHLVAHCEDCEECEDFRAALLAQRTSLRAILPVFPLFFTAKKAWGAASVPQPYSSLSRRMLDIVAGVPASGATVIVTITAMSAMGGLPSRAPKVPQRPAPVFSAPSSRAPTAPAAKPSRPRRIRPVAAARPPVVVPPAPVAPAPAAVPRPAPPPELLVDVDTVVVETQTPGG